MTASSAAPSVPASTGRGVRVARAVLLVVGVALDTVQQIESHLITRNYEGFTGPRGPRIRGRGGRGTGAVGS